MKLVKTNEGISMFIEDRCVAKLHGYEADKSLYIILKMEIFDNQHEDEIVKRLVSWVKTEYSSIEILCLSWDKKEDQYYESILKKLGLTIEYEKAYYERSLGDFEYIKDSILSYRSILELEKKVAGQIIHDVSIGDHQVSIRDESSMSFEEISLLREKRFDRLACDVSEPWLRTWTVAYLKDEIVGVVLPDCFQSKFHMGTFSYFGIIPKFRSKNYGTLLFKKGLSLIKELNATEYYDSTHVKNLSMIKIFESNGCKLKGIRRYWKGDLGFSKYLN